MRRLGKITLVWVAAIMAVVDPASACRFRSRCCRVVYRCYTPCCNPCYNPCYTACPPCGSSCSTYGSGAVTTSPYEDGQPSGPQPTPAAPTPRSITPENVLPEPSPTAPAQRFDEPAPNLLPDTMPEEPAPAFPTEPAPTAPARPAPSAPAPSNDVEDLFKDADDKATPGADLEKAPPAEPEKKSDDLDDLFKDSDDKKSTRALPATKSELEALFADPPAEVSRAVANDHRDGMRVWIDNTGKYRVTARLISIGKSSVRLLKDTGKYTTVPFSRLSTTDLALVRSLSTPVVASAR
jgi:hypothetical protein